MPSLRTGLALLVATAALLSAAAAPARADEITVSETTPLTLELDALRDAFDRILASDLSFAEARRALLRCVDEKTKGGGLAPDTPTTARATVTGALEACASELGVQLPRYGLASYWGLAGIGRAGPAPGVSCVGGSVDPRRGNDGGTAPMWSPGPWDGYLDIPNRYWGSATNAPPDPHADRPATRWQGYSDAAAEADAAWARYHEVWLHQLEQDDRDAYMKQVDAAQKEANDKIKKRDEWQPKIVDDDGEGGNQTGVAQTDPSIQSACAAIAQQIAECAQSGWRSTDCQRLKNRLQGCGYRYEDVIDPMQLEALDPQPCDKHELTAEEAELLLRICQSRMLYGPDGGSPCAPNTGITATVNPVIGWSCIGNGEQRHCYVGGANPCGGALTQSDPNNPAEACQAHATLIELRPALAAVIAEAFTRLGGPVWTPPDPGPPQSGGLDPGGPRP